MGGGCDQKGHAVYQDTENKNGFFVVPVAQKTVGDAAGGIGREIDGAQEHDPAETR